MRQGLDKASGAPLGTRQPPQTLRVPPFLDRPSLRHSHPVDGRTVPCPYFGLLTPVSASPCLPPEPARRVPRSPRFSEENTEEQGAQETCGVLPWEAVRPELVRAAGRGSRAGLGAGRGHTCHGGSSTQVGGPRTAPPQGTARCLLWRTTSSGAAGGPGLEQSRPTPPERPDASLSQSRCRSSLHSKPLAGHGGRLGQLPSHALAPSAGTQASRAPSRWRAGRRPNSPCQARGRASGLAGHTPAPAHPANHVGSALITPKWLGVSSGSPWI